MAGCLVEPQVMAIQMLLVVIELVHTAQEIDTLEESGDIGMAGLIMVQNMIMYVS